MAFEWTPDVDGAVLGQWCCPCRLSIFDAISAAMLSCVLSDFQYTFVCVVLRGRSAMQGHVYVVTQ